MDRHVSALHFPTHLLQIILLLVWAVLSPIREVHVFASLINVADEKPGDWRDVAVPGPARLVGMAIIAGAIENRRDFRRQLRVRLNSLRLVNGRVGSRWPNELHRRHCCDQRDGRPLQYLLYSSFSHESL